MWWPSFLSVLRDLWQFCVGAASSSRVPDKGVLAFGQAFDFRTEAASHNPSKMVQLAVGELLDNQHSVTTAIRASLADYDSHLVQTDLLTVKEWLLFTVLKKNPQLPLLALQLTPVGRWYVTLKGLPGVMIGVTPYTSALMEWNTGAGVGQAALVLEVTPDETIAIGELGLQKPGIYSKQTLSRAEWIEMRPVFTTLA